MSELHLDQRRGIWYRIRLVGREHFRPIDCMYNTLEINYISVCSRACDIFAPPQLRSRCHLCFLSVAWVVFAAGTVTGNGSLYYQLHRQGSACRDAEDGGGRGDEGGILVLDLPGR
ncbi:uncharacterized protein BO97DRAFT_83282 [Aspergillus homomorphus CBS 101889]|uniref:Uncharacterized protein n=1 Tax=Aspergillus homomorphus (strain CBS 101889) TaxID=1450537 RepID=A0A395IA50_ASPHC|nr:hypothetical protein BO97DRAFT_83282 [Aspergillus homomorphus CBS 101889]RAL17092.1 hypothetical protein BO97DRAFT_83282 [Aspergillus homomorphus CBS 101889]